jgi:hypothetical protein
MADYNRIKSVAIIGAGAAGTIYDNLLLRQFEINS